jgi:hypothetical protein
MNARQTLWVLFGTTCIMTVAVLYTGFVKSYLDHEVQTTFFIKRFPTFQMEFFDPFANEGDDVPMSQMSTSDRAEFAAYCKYRFGLDADSDLALEDCKSKIPPYL